MEEAVAFSKTHPVSQHNVHHPLHRRQARLFQQPV